MYVLQHVQVLVSFIVKQNLVVKCECEGWHSLSSFYLLLHEKYFKMELILCHVKDANLQKPQVSLIKLCSWVDVLLFSLNLLPEICKVVPSSQVFSSSSTALSSSVFITANSSLWLWEEPRAWLSTDTWPLPKRQRQTWQMRAKTETLLRYQDCSRHMWHTVLPRPPTSQSFSPPLTLSQEVWGEKTVIPASTALIANRCFQSFWTSLLIGLNNGGWYETMRSQRTPSASSMTAFVRSLVSSMVLIARGLLGSTSKPTLSHDSASDSGASCSSTCRTSLNSIGPVQWAEWDRQQVDGCRTEAGLLVKKWQLWVNERAGGRMDEGDEEKCDKKVQERLLNRANISGLSGEREGKNTIC